MEEISNQTTGGTLTSAKFNEIPKELENIITSAGISLSGADFAQALKALAVYIAAGGFYTGSANTYVLTPASSRQGPISLIAGMRVRFMPAYNNNGASTVAVNGLAVTAIKRNDGVTALSSGVFRTGNIYTLMYDGTVFRVMQGIGQPGVVDGNDASQGEVGEVISAFDTTATALDVPGISACSIVLTPGDWDVNCLLACRETAGAVGIFYAWIYGGNDSQYVQSLAANGRASITLYARINIAVQTTFYLYGRGGACVVAYAKMDARRAR